MAHKYTKEELIEQATNILGMLGALTLAFLTGLVKFMVEINAQSTNTTKNTDNISLGGYSSSTTMVCGVCGQNIARDATLCPFCQRSPRFR